MIISSLRTRRNSSVRIIDYAISKSFFFAVVVLALTTLSYRILPSVIILRSTQHEQNNVLTSANQRSTSEEFSQLNLYLASQHKYPRVISLTNASDSSTTKIKFLLRKKSKIIIKEDQLAFSDLINTTESYINSVLNEFYTHSATSTSEQYTDICVPMASWQTQTYPTCNTVHEIDLLLGVTNENDQNDPYYADEAPPFIIHFIGAGGSRLVFRTAFRDTKEQFALKVLRIDRKFESRYFEYHRIDAIASEQLTSAPDVMDIYGFCGMTALNELSSGYNMGDLLSHNFVWEPLEILEIMLQASVSLAHVHSIKNDVNNRTTAPLVHNDVKEQNFVISMNATLKISDFNRAVPLRWNKTSNESCGFLERRVGGASGITVNSPPENFLNGTVQLNEKIDVYALGQLLFQFLSWHTLYYYELHFDDDLRYSNKSKEEKIKQVIMDPDKLPRLPRAVKNSTDPVVVGLISVMRQALQYNATERPTAQDIANELEGLYDSTEQRAEVVRRLYYKVHLQHLVKRIVGDDG